MSESEARIYTFECPTCKARYVYDEPAEPCCTGPGSTNQHPMVVMRRVHVESRDREKNVSPHEAEERVKGALLIPSIIQQLKLKVNGKLWRPNHV